MAHRTTRTNRRQKGEEGVVLFMVILLVALFSGLGILAMRHTQGELRSANVYMDSSQAAAVAEAAIMMVATDMRRNWRYPNATACVNYYTRFQQAIQSNQTNDIQIGFSDVFNNDANCANIGTVPVAGLQGAAPLAETGGPLSNSYAAVTLTQAAPMIAPPPPGFSSDDENRTYNWYYFTVTSRAAYGYGSSSVSPTVRHPKIIRGEAVVRSHMKIGPVDALPAP
jgi:Tfp pilus assembly protein PilX